MLNYYNEDGTLKENRFTDSGLQKKQQGTDNSHSKTLLSPDSKKYYYYNSKPLGGASVKDLKMLMKNMKSFIMDTDDYPGTNDDTATQYINYSDYKNNSLDKIIQELKIRVQS